jgi:hypothetical protein
MSITANKFLFVWALALTAFITMGLTIPHAFVAGTTISSAEMNANFAAIDTAVDALESPTRPGTLLARCRLQGATGAHTDSWSSTGGAVVTTRNGLGDYLFELVGYNIDYERNLIVVNCVNLGTAFMTTIANGDSIGSPNAIRILTWSAAGAAVDVANIQVAVFNQ